MVLCVRNDVGMGKGKMAAQCSHAALGAYRRARDAQEAVKAAARRGTGSSTLPPEKLEFYEKLSMWLDIWEEAGEAKIAVKLPDAEAGLAVIKAAMLEGINVFCVRDAGRTQVPRGTMTAIAVGPAPISRINKVTGHLKLL
ncbi:peptidyl-tRNA hydrolase 2, mitochondrial [Cyclospora cayetanensis]|uniref:peptidyl-tRNA hydrolase n=1 Tax=Cyclospora cayetanensis TaxID=88456 RepID=A0A6P6RTT8_9EIME|nr:peptidyl-tRNA hydrolase 2, mitochondrial [Cyclospora cayetanensis]